MATEICCPGDRLGPQEDYSAGEGTHLQAGYVCASVVGKKHVKPPGPISGSQKSELQVIRTGAHPVLPQPGSRVTGKVLRVTVRVAAVEILCLGDHALDITFNGIIRVQDVRLTEIDKVDMYACFRPGDIVRAEILSLGDQRSYYLTTAKNELGVVYAKSLAGVPMVPISWVEMQCPETKAVEKRKVAKVTAA